MRSERIVVIIRETLQMKMWEVLLSLVHLVTVFGSSYYWTVAVPTKKGCRVQKYV
jgi:hypothetical protein